MVLSQPLITGRYESSLCVDQLGGKTIFNVLKFPPKEHLRQLSHQAQIVSCQLTSTQNAEGLLVEDAGALGHEVGVTALHLDVLSEAVEDPGGVVRAEAGVDGEVGLPARVLPDALRRRVGVVEVAVCYAIVVKLDHCTQLRVTFQCAQWSFS